MTCISPANGQTVRVFGATPPLDDPNFDRAVIYILEHHNDGAVGVVINKPSDEALDEPLDRWIDLQTAPSSIFDGGPVEDSALIALAHAKSGTGHDENLTPIVGDIVSAEIDAGAWLVLDAETGDVFSSEPDELWRNVLRRQPGRLAWLANAPDDLSLN
jgi:putative transcriptional regulator